MSVLGTGAAAAVDVGPNLSGVDPVFDSPQMIEEVRGLEEALAASAAPVSGEAEGPVPSTELPPGLSFTSMLLTGLINLEATVNILSSKMDRMLG